LHHLPFLCGAASLQQEGLRQARVFPTVLTWAEFVQQREVIKTSRDLLSRRLPGPTYGRIDFRWFKPKPGEFCQRQRRILGPQLMKNKEKCNSTSPLWPASSTSRTPRTPVCSTRTLALRQPTSIAHEAGPDFTGRPISDVGLRRSRLRSEPVFPDKLNDIGFFLRRRLRWQPD